MTDRPIRLGSLKAALEEVAAAGDEARLQLHLLALEARERKDGLGTSIDNLEQRLDRGIEQAVQTAASKTKQLTKTVQELLGRTSTVGSSGQAQVQSIMTEHPHVCFPDDHLNQAAQIMWEVDCGAVLVVDTDQRLCGIITDRDICMAGYMKGIPLWSIRVGDVMTSAVHSCGPSDSIPQAISLMTQHQIRRLPVVDAQGRPIGIIALADLVRTAPGYEAPAAQSLCFRLLRAICRPRRPIVKGPLLAVAE